MSKPGKGGKASSSTTSARGDVTRMSPRGTSGRSSALSHNSTAAHWNRPVPTRKRRNDSPAGDMDFPDDIKLKDNLKFYRNEMASRPFPGHKIDAMLKWKGDYTQLEWNHQYIQWLFPLPEGKGLNISAQALQQHEALEIQGTRICKLRVLKAYIMMLDFYGMELASSDSGEVKKSPNHLERFHHLNKSVHNYRRITRIIKSLGFLGYGHLQAPWVRFLIRQAVIEKTLPKLNCGSMNHWIDAIADESERDETLDYLLKAKEENPYFTDDENTYDSVGAEKIDNNKDVADVHYTTDKREFLRYKTENPRHFGQTTTYLSDSDKTLSSSTRSKARASIDF